MHQILSLLGQKVHVPVEAKARMYQLVKGRESTPVARGTGSSRRFVACHSAHPALGRACAPSPTLAGAVWPRRRLPGPGCPPDLVGLSEPDTTAGPNAVLRGSSATPARSRPGRRGLRRASRDESPRWELAARGRGSHRRDSRAGDSKDATVAVKEAKPEATTGSEAASSKPADNSGKPKNEPGATPPARVVPAGSVGVVDKVDGLLLRFHAEKREWERIAEGTSLSTSDRLVCLEPFRARILVAKTPITLIGEAQVVLTSKTAEEPPAFELTDGRALIEGSAPSGSLKIGFAGLTASIDRPSHGAVGLERTSLWHYGQPPTQLPPLAIHALDGELSLALDGTKER